MAARPREFDMDTVLEAAMKAFWNRGYEATSMADLMEVTGLQKGSIYKAFGDKHSLFMRTLERYLEITIEEMREASQVAEKPIDKIDHIMRTMIEKRKNAEECLGCYAANTLVELSDHDEEAASLLQNHILQLSQFFVPIISAGQKMGEIRKDEPAESLFQFITIFMIGMASFSKGGMTEEQGIAQKDLCMKMIRG